MVISSRTPEGTPCRCPICRTAATIKFSEPAQDAPCPRCGHLLWASAIVIESLEEHFNSLLNTAPGLLNSETLLKDMGVDSLDQTELVVSLAEELDILIPDEAVEDARTLGDVVRLIERYAELDL